MQVPDSAKWQTPGESGLEKVDPQGKNLRVKTPKGEDEWWGAKGEAR